MTTTPPVTPKLLLWALGAQIVLGGVLLWQAATDFALFRGDEERPPTPAPMVAAGLPAANVDRFDERRAMRWARRQVELGPRPAGSPAQREAAAFLRPALPRGRFVPIPGHEPLRNILGELPGKGKPILLIAHYDTTTVPGYRGANNAAAAVGAVIEIARSLRRDHDPTRDRPVQFLLTDGEEPPTWPPERDFYSEGLRGSKFAAETMSPGEVIVMDFVAQKGLSLPREQGSDPELWAQLREAAQRVGVGSVFPDEERAAVLDDHTPFVEKGVPAIDLIDFDYACWQKPCDTMDKLSTRALNASGETVLELIRTLR